MGTEGHRAAGTSANDTPEHQNGHKSQSLTRHSREQQSEHQMATDQQQRSEDKHGGATTELVETVPQRRSQHQRADREPPQQVGSRLGRDAEIALQHVGAETLEGKIAE